MLRLAGPGAVASLESAGADPADVAALTALQPGEGAPLAFTVAAGETATAMAHVQGGGLLMILPNAAAAAVEEAAAAAGGREVVQVMDLAEQCVLLSILGPGVAHSLFAL